MLISRQPQKIARAPECLAKKLAVVATPTTFLSRSMQEGIHFWAVFFFVGVNSCEKYHPLPHIRVLHTI